MVFLASDCNYLTWWSTKCKEMATARLLYYLVDLSCSNDIKLSRDAHDLISSERKKLFSLSLNYL